MASHLWIDRILVLHDRALGSGDRRCVRLGCRHGAARRRWRFFGQCAPGIRSQWKSEKARPGKEPTCEAKLAHDHGVRSMFQLGAWQSDLCGGMTFRLRKSLWLVNCLRDLSHRGPQVDRPQVAEPPPVALSHVASPRLKLPRGRRSSAFHRGATIGRPCVSPHYYPPIRKDAPLRTNRRGRRRYQSCCSCLRERRSRSALAVSNAL